MTAGDRERVKGTGLSGALGGPPSGDPFSFDIDACFKGGCAVVCLLWENARPRKCMGPSSSVSSSVSDSLGDAALDEPA